MPALRPVLVVASLVALAVAGCVDAPGATVDAPPARQAPRVVAEGANVTVAGDAAFAAWEGSVRPPGSGTSTPVADLPDPESLNAGPAVVDLAFGFPSDATVMEAWLNWTDERASLGFAILNDTGRSWCGARFPSGTAGSCFATFYLPPPGDLSAWRARVFGNSYDGPAADVPFTLTVSFRNLSLPILGPPAAAGPSSPIPFDEPVLVSDEKHTAEPSIAVSGKGTIWVAAPTGPQESLWRSDDDGKTFALVQIHGNPAGDPGSAYAVGGGDSDVALNGEQTIYFADQQGGSGETVSVSHDGGKTWFTQPLSAGPPARPGLPLPVNAPVPVSPPWFADRQWLVTDGGMRAWMAFNSNLGATVVQTQDGGRTWPIRAYMGEDNCFRGNLARAPDGTLYFAGCNEEGPGVGVSTDGGLTFTWRQVATRKGPTDTSFIFPAHIFVVATTDAAGNAYVVWSDEAQTPDATGPPEGGARGLNVWLASSTDQGQTWSKPKKVNAINGTFVEPWATGGAPGHVAVGYYGTRYEGNPERAMGEWYVVVAATDDATAEAPVWKEAVASDIVQYGPICMRGSACGNARNLLDFFQLQAGSDGRLHVAYADGRAGGSARLSDIMYVHSAGPVLGGPSVDKMATP